MIMCKLFNECCNDTNNLISTDNSVINGRCFDIKFE